MQHTTKYKFNLIETSDTFSPDALNANAQAMETQLAALAAADAAVRSEFAVADAALKATATADKAALQTAINALNADVHPGAPGQIARIATGTYTGKGTVGSGGACKLEFDFKPLLVFVCSTVDSCSHRMMRPGKFSNATDSHVSASVIWNEQSVSWYVSTSYMPDAQCNTKNTTYSYIAIGVPV